jgi:hypothetical protein
MPKGPKGEKRPAEMIGAIKAAKSAAEPIAGVLPRTAKTQATARPRMQWTDWRISHNS